MPGSLSVNVYLGNLPSGTASIVADENKHISVRLDAFGFRPSTPHSIRIHAGTCLTPQRSAAIVVADVTSDRLGVIKTLRTSAKPVTGGIPAPGVLTIEVGTLVLNCTDIPKAPTSAEVRLFAPPGHKPGGVVTLRSVRGALTLSFRLLAFPPGSKHVVRILEGTCRAPGHVAAQLEPVTVDAIGSVKADRRPKDIRYPFTKPLSIVVNDTSAVDSHAILCGDVPATSG